MDDVALQLARPLDRRLATHGQHGVVVAAPGRRVRPGSLQRGFAVPAESQPRPRPPHPDQACSAMPGTICGD
jgi:hypothetical protein